MKTSDKIIDILVDLSCIRKDIKDANSMIESAKIDFQKSFLKIFPPGTKLLGGNSEKPKQSNSKLHSRNTEGVEERQTTKKSDDKIVKKIYRKIALKTHPDKNSLKEDKEKKDLMLKYQDATEMYKKNRIVELLEIAYSLDIDISDFPAGKLRDLKKELASREKILKDIKLDFFYVWSQSNFEKRCNTVFKIARDLKIDVEEEKIKLVLRRASLERTTGAHPGSHIKRIKDIPM